MFRGDFQGGPGPYGRAAPDNLETFAQYQTYPNGTRPLSNLYNVQTSFPNLTTISFQDIVFIKHEDILNNLQAAVVSSQVGSHTSAWPWHFQPNGPWSFVYSVFQTKNAPIVATQINYRGAAAEVLK